MKQRTRLFSMFLALVMCLSLLPGTALADDYWGLILTVTEAYGAGPGWKMETRPGPTYTVTLMVDAPDGYSYEESHSLPSSHITITWTGEGVPSVNTGSGTTGSVTSTPGGELIGPPAPTTGSDNLSYTVTNPGNTNGSQSRGRTRMTGEHETREEDHYTLFTPLDPTEVIEHNFSPWIFKGWLCQETGEMISGETRADRNMTLVAQ